MNQARSTYWRMWAAKHEYEELKEGIWLEPALALLRRKTKGELTDKHRHVAIKLVLEGGWVQKSLFLPLVGQMTANAKLVTSTEKHRLYYCPGWNDVRRQIPEVCRKWEQRAGTSKKEWQSGIVTHLLHERQRNRDHFSLNKREQQKILKAISPRMALFWALQESGENVVGQWRKWTLMQEMYGSMDAELEVQRTIKKAELAAFPCLLKKVNADL